MPQSPYLSTDPTAGEYLSTDPNAGEAISPATAQPSPTSPSLWQRANTPLVPIIASAAHAIANHLDAPALDRSKTAAQIRGALAGSIGAIGDLAVGFTSPVGIALALSGIGPESRAAQSLPGLSRLLELPAVKTMQAIVPRLIGAGFVGSGAGQTMNAVQNFDASEPLATAASTLNVAQGLGQMAGGGHATLRGMPPAQTRAAELGQADRLTREATDQVASRVLAPANPKYRAQAPAVAGQILKRGLTGDRVDLQQAADALIGNAHEAIDRVTDAEPPQTVLDTKGAVKALDASLSQMKFGPGHVTNPLMQKYASQLKELRDFIAQQGPGLGPKGALIKSGPGLPLSEIRRLRGQFDEIAAQAGAFATKSGNAELGEVAAAAEQAGNALRGEIAQQRPALMQANADMHLGLTIRDILDPAKGRPSTARVPMGVTGGLATASAIAGSAVSHIPIIRALASYLASDLIPKIKNAQVSPENQLRLATQKYALAEALRNGDVGLANSLARKITLLLGPMGAASSGISIEGLESR